MTICTVEVLLGDDAESLGRVVRIASLQPFILESLHFWRSPGSRRRLVLEVQVRRGGAELLSNRLNRLVAVERVRVLDRQDPPPISAHPSPTPYHGC